MAVLHLTKENFNEVINSGKPVLVDFFATWCGPCKMLGPVIENIAEENADVTVAKLDIDEEFEIAAGYGVNSVPTVMLFKDGQVVKTSVGVVPKAVLESMFK